ncbi:hypothetical protein MHZ93_11925 [Roseomonas sp. ACRSG]|nr:hypothetical protein [Roseomonas sp. ACRSG]
MWCEELLKAPQALELNDLDQLRDQIEALIQLKAELLDQRLRAARTQNRVSRPINRRLRA